MLPEIRIDLIFNISLYLLGKKKTPKIQNQNPVASAGLYRY